MLLYKYVTEDRISILKDGLIRFSQPQAFNDPFELKPHISEIMDRAGLEKTISDLLPEIIKNEYDKQPQEFRNKIPFEIVMSFAEVNAEKIIGDKDLFLASGAKIMQQIVCKGIEKVIGILSLSESANNLLMWAHYANSHQGFVIEFDSSNKFFNQQINENDELRYLRKVSYSDERPNIRINVRDGSDAGVKMFLAKSNEWSYEKEWRIMLPLEHSDKKIKSVPHDIHLFKIPFSAISKVIIGARATQETVQEIKEAIAVNSEFNHTKLCKMLIDDKRYELKMEEI
jgi:hypothetical protein